MTQGIYALRFKGTDKVYIGQSEDIETRFIDHKSNMRRGTSSIKLNNAYKQYGEATLDILTECSKENLDTFETETIDIFDSVSNGFNTQSASSTGSRPDLRGELGPMSTCSNHSVREAFHLLVDNASIRMEEIAELVGISRNIVKDISAGNSHKWLMEEFPDKYASLQKMRGARNNGELSATSTYTNDQILGLFNMCVEHPEMPLTGISKLLGIPYDTVKAVVSGRNHKWLAAEYPEKYALLMIHKGQRGSNCRSAKNRGIEYPKIVSPEGVEYTVENAAAFARSHGLNSGHLGAVLRGREKHHKQWRLVSQAVGVETVPGGVSNV